MPQPCRLRAHRKAAALSQRDLGLLLGHQGQSIVSDYETATKQPGVQALIGCEIVMGVPARELFPALYADVARQVAANAKALAAEPDKRPARYRDARLAFLRRLIPVSLTS